MARNGNMMSQNTISVSITAPAQIFENKQHKFPTINLHKSKLVTKTSLKN